MHVASNGAKPKIRHARQSHVRNGEAILPLVPSLVLKLQLEIVIAIKGDARFGRYRFAAEISLNKIKKQNMAEEEVIIFSVPEI